ncbi:hypothetical protein [Vescimonas sp.]|uniref:hypothetical protein n=1 Tax=Vescimonas sp. TaxID=2892404 RepID=UPI00307C389F
MYVAEKNPWLFASERLDCIEFMPVIAGAVYSVTSKTALLKCTFNDISLIGFVVPGTFKVTLKVSPGDACVTEALTPLSAGSAHAGTAATSKLHIMTMDKRRGTIRLFMTKLLFIDLRGVFCYAPCRSLA